MILVLESVIRDGWCAISGGGLSSHEGVSPDDGGESVGISQEPVMYFCDHSFSRSMTASSSDEGNCPVEVSSACMSVMNVEMTGLRYCTVGLPICVSLVLMH